MANNWGTDGAHIAVFVKDRQVWISYTFVQHPCVPADRG